MQTKDVFLKDGLKSNQNGPPDRSAPQTGAYGACLIKFMAHYSVYHMAI